MGHVKRRKRRWLAGQDSLAAAWNRGDAPPEWAYEPGEHHQELLELYFFGTDEDWKIHRRAKDHPHYNEWREAMKASNQG